MLELLNRTEPLVSTAPSCAHELDHTHDRRPDRVVERSAEICAALGDPARLRLLELLLDQRHCVSELASETAASLSSVSQRMKILTAARLVHRTREGRHVYYSLADDHIHQILRQVFAHAAEE